MKVIIDKEKCIGCGVCANVCPQGIELADGKAVIKDDNVACLKEAADVCPINIIKIN